MKHFFCLAFVMACSTPTQVVVGFEAETAVAERATSIRVRLYRDDVTSAFYDESVDANAFDFPARVPVLPTGDEMQRFVVLGELSDAEGVFSTVRAETRFVPGELRYVWLRFEDACTDNACSEGTSCRAGLCQGACVVAGSDDVRPTPSRACEGVIRDGGVDGAVSDAGVDTGPSPDTGVDTGPEPDGGPDSGPPCTSTCECADLCVDGECLPAEEVESVALGSSHTCAITESGLFCWGDNDSGQVGTGDMMMRDSPVLVIEAADAAEVALGNAFSLLRYDDKSVFSWGSNANGRLGLGLTSEELAQSLEPMQVGTSRFDSIEAGDVHACGVEESVVLCWGGNEWGQARPALAPTDVLEPRVVWNDDIDGVSAGAEHTCAITGVDGSRMLCWGRPDGGRLCRRPIDGNIVRRTVGPLNYDRAAAGGAHTCGRTPDREIYCFGGNARGQLGDEQDTGSRNFASVRVVVGGPWSQVSSGGQHSCAIRENVIHCWGSNSDGQLGLPEVFGDSRVPLPLPGAWRDVATGNNTTCAIDERGALYCWGNNDDGRLGVGDDDERRAPTRVCVESL